jgi:tubulin--tyrosine ligase-like protein 12
LQAIGFPTELVEQLFNKLRNTTLDAGSALEFAAIEDDSHTPYGVFAKKNLSKNSEVFLIDHVWTTTIEKAFPSLVGNEKLRTMCCQLMNITSFEDSQAALDHDVDHETQEEDHSVKEAPESLNIELDETFPSGYYLNLCGNALTLFPQLDIEADKREHVVAINISNNNISDLNVLLESIPSDLKKTVKALYMQDNIVSMSFHALKQVVSKHFANLEILNSKFMDNFTEWAILYLCDATSPDDVTAIDVSDRSIVYWDTNIFTQFKNCVSLNVTKNKIENINDFVDTISKMPKLRSLMIDYAYQQHIHEAFKQNKITNIKVVNQWYIHLSTPSLAELTATEICRRLWEYMETYKLSNQHVSLWYLMDQLGLSIQHNDSPNVKIAPFFYYDTQETYTLLWPIQDIQAGQEVQRDYLHGLQDAKKRYVLRSIWHPLTSDELKEKIEEWSPSSLENVDAQPKRVQLDMDMFNKKKQSLLKVYTDSKMVVQGLSEYRENKAFEDVDDVKFELVELPENADILWYTHEHFRDYDQIVSKKQFVNQFRNEHLFTIKAELARAVKNLNLPFTIETYDMTVAADLAKFMLKYREYRDKGEENIWIVKPANLSRSLNMNVVIDENAVLKLTEIGPCIVSKYIAHPCTITGRKFDLRLYLIVATHPRNVPKAQITTYMTDDIVIRVANNPYSLDTLHDFEKHFTVMNYRNEEAPDQVKKIIMGRDEFIKLFNQEYDNKWEQTQNKIRIAVKQLFDNLSDRIVTETIDTYCAALYGIDVMLDAELKPHILEINYGPDCRTVCRQHPGFFVDVFKCMFTDKELSPTIVELQ